MRMRKATRRLIAGGLGFVMAASMFATNSMVNVTDVQAKQRVFDQITTNYPSDMKKFTILEIVPDGNLKSYTNNVNRRENDVQYGSTVNIHSSAEMGYFIARTPQDTGYSTDQRQANGVTGVTRGAKYGNAFNEASTSTEYGTAMYQMYTYGMIKPDGMDSQGVNTKVGEYPIYADAAILNTFYNATTNQALDKEKSLAKGVYTMATGGDYQVAQGYTVSDNGAIYEVTESERDVPNPDYDFSLSENSVSNNGIPPYIKEPYTVYTMVTDVDTTALQLPKSSVTGKEYIIHVGNGTGNASFARSEVATTKYEYYGLSDLGVFYTVEKDQGKIKYSSSDWFREYVLGDGNAYNQTRIDYRTVKAAAVTTKDIDDADLIYISGQDKMFVNGEDLTAEVALHLYNKVTLDHKAVIMDYLSYNANLKTNISKLALLLWQNEQDSFRTAEKDDFDSITGKLLNWKFLDKDTTVSMLKSGMDNVVNGSGSTNGNFVRGNVYVYNHHITDFKNAKSKVDALDNFATGDFNSAYSTVVTSSGFTEVLGYINATNKSSMKGAMGSEVTPAVAIQYILISDGQEMSIMKTALRILEIQPVPSYLYNPERGYTEYTDLDSTNNRDKTIINNRKKFVKDYLSNYYNVDVDDEENTMLKFIDFTSMTVSEFNGRNEDLVENYDIIYIGDEMERLNANNTKSNLYFTKRVTTTYWNPAKTDLNKYESKEIDIPKYTDTMMNGNIYFTIGDQLKGMSYNANNGNLMVGYIDGETVDKTNRQTNVRHPGRDITKNKLNKMIEFLDANGLMIIAEDLLGDTTGKLTSLGIEQINPTDNRNKDDSKRDRGRVDNSSNMYELIAYGLGYRFNKESGNYENKPSDSDLAYNRYANMISASFVVQNPSEKEKMNQFVVSDKLSLILTDRPTPYAYNTKAGSSVIESVDYLSYKEDGKRCLKYDFKITSELETLTPDHYNIDLFIDINNDGKYSKTTEKVEDVTITDIATTLEAPKDENGNYVLNPNVNYTLKRTLADEYCGLVKWKLQVTSVTKSYLHASDEGYTLVENITGEDKKVKILQIATVYHDNKSWSNPTLNLETQWKNKTSKWGKYLADVPGYDVYIKTVSITDFEKDLQTSYDTKYPNKEKSVEDYAISEFFPEYDLGDGIKGVNMIVFGFGDDYEFFKNEYSVRACQTFIERGKPVLMTHDFLMFYPQSKQSLWLRSNIGMDKYGVTQNIVSSKDKDNNTVYSFVNHFKEPNNGSKVLHQDAISTRSANKGDVIMMESVGNGYLSKEVAYQPGSGRGTVVKEKQGYTNLMTAWFRYDNNANVFINADAAKLPQNSSAYQTNYDVEKLNEGQITEYPYKIVDSFRTQETHSQYFELDLTQDADQDGESDVVVWYALGNTGKTGGGTNLYGDRLGASLDPANGFYIYNCGNVTYTGAGHRDITNADETEIQLFINTLLAAFEVGNDKPAAGFYESVDKTAKPISCIAVPYDGNVTKPVAGASGTDSSILKDTTGDYLYKFADPIVSPNMPADDITSTYFRVVDSNLVRGEKTVTTKYYIKVEKSMLTNSNAKIDDTLKTVNAFGREFNVISIAVDSDSTIKTEYVIDISSLINTYNVNQSSGVIDRSSPRTKNSDGSVDGIISGDAYAIDLPMSLLKDNAVFTLYLESTTKIKSTSTSGTEIETETKTSYTPLSVTKADLLKLD